jgi:Ca2+-binding RTX toxin-like protein
VSADPTQGIQEHAALCGCAACTSAAASSGAQPQSSVVFTLTTWTNSFGLTNSVAGLLAPDEYRWNYNAPGTPLSLTYGFMTTVPGYADPGNPGWFGFEHGYFQPFNALQQQAVHRAIQHYEEICNVDFTFVGNGNAADVRFGNAILDSWEAAHAYYPDRTGTGDWEGDVWFNWTETYMHDPWVGSYAYMVVLHEIGHTLGLKHPHDDGVPLPYGEDNRQYTVMSYNEHPNYWSIEPSSLLLYDIAALQYLYGANMSTRSGDTVYSWNPNALFIECIWDGGGNDTIDASNQTRRVIINLNAGTFSSIGANGGGDAINNLSIAFDCVIENAIGGSGNDTLIGNSAANRLEGGAGEDLLRGGGGADIFVGGSGFDTVSFQGATQWEGLGDLSIDLATGIHGGAAAGAQFIGIEAIVGGPGYDLLVGDAGANWLYGGLGLNTLIGGGGADYLDGGLSTGDTVSYAGSASGVKVDLSTGRGYGGDAEGDQLVNFEEIIGSDFDDWLIGDSGVNWLKGGAGNDYLDGGVDQLWDTYSGGTGDDIFIVNLESESVYENAGEGFDEIRTTTNYFMNRAHVEKLVFVGTGAFEGQGNAVNTDEIFVGGAGNDRFRGIRGNDLIDGGSGNDTAVYRGNRADYHVVRTAGQVTVTDLRIFADPTETDGTDTLISIERLEFADTTISVNTTPVVAGISQGAPTHGTTWIAAQTFVHASDPDGDALTYEFWDESAGGGFFTVAGVAQGSNVAIRVEAADIATVRYQLASTTDSLWVRATDGWNWSEWKSLTVAPPPNAAPNVAGISQLPGKGTTSIAAGSLLSFSDSDSDPIVSYQFWDENAGGGYFTVGGVAQSANTAITVAVGDIADVRYQLGSTTDTLWVRASDGLAWSEWTSLVVTPPQNRVPIVSGLNQWPTKGTTSLAAGSLLSYSDADGDAVVSYMFWDESTGGGHFTVNGAVQGANTAITVAAANIADVRYQLGATTDTVWVRAFDGIAWSEWASVIVTPPANRAPTVAGVNQTPGKGTTSLAASGLLNASDPDGDAVVSYMFWDESAVGGYFTVNGATQADNTAITVAAANIADARWQLGATTDTVWVRASDGTAWSEWAALTVSPPANHVPLVAGINQQANANTALAVTSLFTATDGDGDTITRYQFWDERAAGGRFEVSGVAQTDNVAIEVMAANLAAAVFVTSGTSGSDTIWARAFDGTAWGEWKSSVVTTLVA